MSPRALTIAVTGHRQNRLFVGETRLRMRIGHVLGALRAGAARSGRSSLVALTSLAEGADRIFADAALGLGLRLDVLIPFAGADYETTFEHPEATPHYRSLIGRASHVDVLPGDLADGTAAYEAVGRACVMRCDVLVAVWDGKPAAGRGGSPDIVAYALSLRRPVVWIDAARDGPPRFLSIPTASGRQPGSLQASVRRARPITMSKLAALAHTLRMPAIRHR